MSKRKRLRTAADLLQEMDAGRFYEEHILRKHLCRVCTLPKRATFLNDSQVFAVLSQYLLREAYLLTHGVHLFERDRHTQNK